MFESREICGKMWQNATMLGGDNVRKEKFKIKCPKRIQFGDPLYYEDFKDKPERLKKLVVDYKPKPEFKAGVLLTEMEYPEFPGIHGTDNDRLFCTGTISFYIFG